MKCNQFAAWIGACNLVVLLFYVVNVDPLVAQVRPLSKINTQGHEYAPALYATASGTELWYTSQSGERNRELHIVSVDSRGALGSFRKANMTFNPPPGPNRELFDPVGLHGCPSLTLCPQPQLYTGLASYGMFASDRLHGGEFQENDLYEFSLGPSGFTPRRSNQLSSPYWDDTPCLSEDGRIVVFSSDRAEPNSGKADIYIAKRQPGGWGAPQRIAEISTPQFSEESPFIGSDGFLYFCSDSANTFDIWRIAFDAESGQITKDAEPQRWTELGINTENFDERHPVFTPDGKVVLFSSNREGNYDIYQKVLQASQPNLTIKAIKTGCRTSSVNNKVTGADPYKEPFVGQIRISDTDGRRVGEYKCDKDGIVELSYAELVGDPSLSISTPSVFRIEALTSLPNVLSSSVLLSSVTRCSVPDSVFIVVADTTTCEYYSCGQNVELTDTRMYVNAYWCATTRVYSDYLGPCISVFRGEPFRAMEDLVKNSDCIDYNDADNNAETYANDVDSKIPKLIADLRVAFNRRCIRRAIAQGKKIEVTVNGFTDSSGYDAHCVYAGHPIEYDAGSVTIKGKLYPITFKEDARMRYNGKINTGIRFDDFAQGNQLLSDLRGIHFAVFLDDLLKDSIDFYREHRVGANPPIRVTAVGNDYRPPMPGQSLAAHRSVTVDVTVPESLEKLQVELPENIQVGEACDCKLAVIPHKE